MLPTPTLSKWFAALLNMATINNAKVDISALEGRSFAIAIDELPQDIAVKIENAQVYALADEAIATVDVTVSGNIKAILNMIRDEDGLDADELYIAGKISTARHVQHFLSSLSIDWQGFFARFLPESTAIKAADAIEQGIHFAKGSAENFAESLKRYVIEDKRLLVARHELEQFSEDLQRFEQRLNALSQSLNRII